MYCIYILHCALWYGIYLFQNHTARSIVCRAASASCHIAAGQFDSGSSPVIPVLYPGQISGSGVLCWDASSLLLTAPLKWARCGAGRAKNTLLLSLLECTMAGISQISVRRSVCWQQMFSYCNLKWKKIAPRADSFFFSTFFYWDLLIPHATNSRNFLEVFNT